MKSQMNGWRNEHEDVLLERFREVLPEGVRVTVLADRGFGDQARYEPLKDQLGLDFVVRFRGIVKVESADGEVKAAKDWVPANGRPLLLRGAKVTNKGRELGAVVCVKAKGMKDAWCLATSHGDKPASESARCFVNRLSSAMYSGSSENEGMAQEIACSAPIFGLEAIEGHRHDDRGLSKSGLQRTAHETRRAEAPARPRPNFTESQCSPSPSGYGMVDAASMIVCRPLSNVVGTQPWP